MKESTDAFSSSDIFGQPPVRPRHGGFTRGVAVFALVSMGCYSYAPATLETVPLNSQVSALLSTEAQIRLERRTGLNTRELRGELVDRNGETVYIAVPSTGPFTGVTGQPLYQRIDFQTGDILRVDVRQPAPAKTIGLLAVLAGAAVGFVVIATGESNPGSENGNGPPPPPDERRFSWLTVPLIIP